MLLSLWVSHTVKPGYPVLPPSNPSKISLLGSGCAVARDSHSKKEQILRKPENCLSVTAGSAGVGYRFPSLPLNLHRRMELGVRADAERHRLSSSPISPSQNYLLIRYESEKAFFPGSEVILYELLDLTFSLNYLQKHSRQARRWLDGGNHDFTPLVIHNHWNRFLALPSASFRSWTNLRVQRLHQCELCTNCQQKRTNQRQISEQMINSGTITKYIS